MKKWLTAAGVAVASIAVAPTAAFAQDVGQLNTVFDNLTDWLGRIVFRLAIPAAIVGAILLMFGHSAGRRIIWATVIAIFIVIFARPLINALPSIVFGATFP